ncbi:hypothetical protein Patl1_07767 [Pistacia atlantica]|uniref:Uncharacterized protein n=1 Tax=Pistacia atlantica TaxID=434234 RepID=A0ACC1AKQ2_9ROSI|nr:hypothetical protein Patl1_07767 [Pistacia atlantica]
MKTTMSLIGKQLSEKSMWLVKSKSLLLQLIYVLRLSNLRSISFSERFNSINVRQQFNEPEPESDEKICYVDIDAEAAKTWIYPR